MELPGGSLERFEPLLDCLQQEVLEETGLQVTDILDETDQVVVTNRDAQMAETVRPFAVYQTIQGDFPSMGVYFRCHPDGELLSEGDGAANARWFPVDELAQVTQTKPNAFMTFDLSGMAH